MALGFLGASCVLAQMQVMPAVPMESTFLSAEVVRILRAWQNAPYKLLRTEYSVQRKPRTALPIISPEG